MKSKFQRFSTSGRIVGRVSLLGFLLGFMATGAAHAQYQGTAEQRRACTPDVYRLCAGEIPNVRAITACLQRQKSSLSPACRAAMDQNGY
ncbi:MAG: hypothetical protein JOY90_16490 [Bradyrhizobium sp.]|uniref:hypothetical protein n=1 Tax=Bradyrhizobium sp. TaxID=376 RepID=UPI001D8E161B|nr:hypothetical protein [Bradyrhizobium sp.]MBV9562022.1 hypothetical protein [Bradyrhizobium sp.]